MTKRIWRSAFALCGGAALLGGCLEDESLRVNVAPEAHAGDDQQLDYDGQPVTVRLDGHKSSDRDGEIVRYVWRSTQLGADGGAPEFASGALDPDDRARPELELDRGSYTFTLWVVDDDGATSVPDTVTINVGTDPIAQCVEDSLGVVPEPCRACSCASEVDGTDCAEATAACREDCWGLIRCIVEQGCATGDTACIIAGCGPFLGGADQATAVGPCVMPCAEACAEDGGGDAGS